MSNYRPVSLLQSLSKVLEAFRKGTNIENVVFTLTDIILTSLNHRQQHDLLYGIYHTAKPVIYADDTSVLSTFIHDLQIES